MGGRGQTAGRRLRLGPVGGRTRRHGLVRSRHDATTPLPEPQVEERRLPDAGDGLDPRRLLRPLVDPMGDEEQARITLRSGASSRRRRRRRPRLHRGRPRPRVRRVAGRVPRTTVPDHAAVVERYAVGIGEYLDRHTDLDWQVVTDVFGTDLALTEGFKGPSSSCRTTWSPGGGCAARPAGSRPSSATSSTAAPAAEAPPARPLLVKTGALASRLPSNGRCGRVGAGPATRSARIAGLRETLETPIRCDRGPDTQPVRPRSRSATARAGRA